MERAEESFVGTRNTNIEMSLHQPSTLSTSSSSCSCSSSTLFNLRFGGGGPLYGVSTSSTSKPVTRMGDIYDAFGAFATSAGSNYTAFTTSNLSQGGEMTPSSVNGRFPFTATQWQELERQTMIFKYIMASIPVPPELLLATTTTPTNASPSLSNMVVKSSLELGICGYTNNQDPEPWRCKRTDGKKWRCSRDVAPDQKYCERHSHKSRPRSRKPVELHPNTNNNSSKITSTTNNNNNSNHNNYMSNMNLSMFNPCQVASTATSLDQPRGLGWFLKGETASVASNSNQEWQHLKNDINKVYPCTYTRDGYSFQSDPRRPPDDQSSLLLSHKAASSQETRHFIDAWSLALGRDQDDNSGIGGRCTSASSSEKSMPLSSLELSMSGGNCDQTNEENEDAQVGSFCFKGLETGGVSSDGLRAQWMSTTTHGSWMGSPPGGPLAEALCLGISSSAKAASNPASPR